ncbi:MAG: carboxypeptidase-like regulatory domain-containing protein [Bacteroidota bacterium]
MKNLSLYFTFVFSSLSLVAQSSLEGSIYDTDGEPIAAATVFLRPASSAFTTLEITTDESGYFFIENIEDGEYELVTTSKTYDTVRVQHFEFPKDTDQVVGLILEKKEEVYVKDIANEKVVLSEYE